MFETVCAAVVVVVTSQSVNCFRVNKLMARERERERDRESELTGEEVEDDL
jgi:hypothetical protein